MPPGKRQPTPEELKRLLRDHKIDFVGPVPPRDWPAGYAHLFQVVRNIHGSVLDTYTPNSTLSRAFIARQRERIREIRHGAATLRQNTTYNESTWRELIETIVVGRFKKEVLCQCENEKFASEFEAQPRTEAERETLEVRRKRRKFCECHTLGSSDPNFNSSRTEMRDTTVFHTEIGEEVFHDPDDDWQDFQHLRISMKPDRIIGLNMNDNYRELIAGNPSSLVHHPGSHQQLLYPFCIMEAKKERKAPGFRAVEAQTAFPLRRLLLMQKALGASYDGGLEPLVWFLANQGDIWRLYAAVPVLEEIKVYDLWLGSIESEDGALQILQIMDFIWSWARDIYRAQIRRCLRREPRTIREISPTSTVNFSRQSSVLSERIVRQTSIPLSTNSQTLVAGLHYLEAIRDDNSLEIPQPLQEVDVAPLLSWVDPKRTTPSPGAECIVRHSDRILFAFSIFELDELFNDMDAEDRISSHDRFEMQEAFNELHGARCVVQLTFGQLLALKHYWLGQEIAGHTSLGDVFNVCLLFRTRCERPDWQITRTLYCFIWSSPSPNGPNLPGFLQGFTIPGRSIPSSNLSRALDQLKYLRGANSVYGALAVSILALSSDVVADNEQPPVYWLPIGADLLLYYNLLQILQKINDDSNLLVPFDKRNQEQRFLEVVKPGSRVDVPTVSFHDADDAEGQEAVLVLRPETWKGEGPNFCLFIWEGFEADHINKEKIKRALHQLIMTKKISRDASAVLLPDERRLLARWDKSFNS